MELCRVPCGRIEEQGAGVLAVAEGDAVVVEGAEVGEAEDEPVLVVVCRGDGGAAEDEVGELAALGEGVAECGEGLFGEGRV